MDKLILEELRDGEWTDFPVTRDDLEDRLSYGSVPSDNRVTRRIYDEFGSNGNYEMFILFASVDPGGMSWIN